MFNLRHDDWKRMAHSAVLESIRVALEAVNEQAADEGIEIKYRMRIDFYAKDIPESHAVAKEFTAEDEKLLHKMGASL